MTKQRRMKSLSLRLTEDKKERWKSLAEREHRSLTGFITWLINEFDRRYPPDPQKTDKN
jgi:uncharacterized protein (DUF1778 family)